MIYKRKENDYGFYAMPVYICHGTIMDGKIWFEGRARLYEFSLIKTEPENHWRVKIKNENETIYAKHGEWIVENLDESLSIISGDAFVNDFHPCGPAPVWNVDSDEWKNKKSREKVT